MKATIEEVNGKMELMDAKIDKQKDDIITSLRRIKTSLEPVTGSLEAESRWILEKDLDRGIQLASGVKSASEIHRNNFCI
ncbi:hypothetical protein Zmor_002145 [Zophobas morio]|uniref:Uncharacterized protein n=1 Tax=Zophobas morio TaxID=2755281 RepID=A0AA38MTD5_9CUCU|nr:hypothetical protein Zmor_002145 [Zophobas morio]